MRMRWEEGRDVRWEVWSAGDEGGEVRGQVLEVRGVGVGGWGVRKRDRRAESVVNACIESKSTDYLGALPHISTQTVMWNDIFWEKEWGDGDGCRSVAWQLWLSEPPWCLIILKSEGGLLHSLLLTHPLNTQHPLLVPKSAGLFPHGASKRRRLRDQRVLRLCSSARLLSTLMQMCARQSGSEGRQASGQACMWRLGNNRLSNHSYP